MLLLVWHKMCLCIVLCVCVSVCLCIVCVCGQVSVLCWCDFCGPGAEWVVCWLVFGGPHRSRDHSGTLICLDKAALFTSEEYLDSTSGFGILIVCRFTISPVYMEDTTRFQLVPASLPVGEVYKISLLGMRTHTPISDLIFDSLNRRRRSKPPLTSFGPRSVPGQNRPNACTSLMRTVHPNNLHPLICTVTPSVISSWMQSGLEMLKGNPLALCWLVAGVVWVKTWHRFCIAISQPCSICSSVISVSKCSHEQGHRARDCTPRLICLYLLLYVVPVPDYVCCWILATHFFRQIELLLYVSSSCRVDYMNIEEHININLFDIFICCCLFMCAA